MEGSPGVKSDDSAATSDEYEIVAEDRVGFETKEPRLRIANNGNLADLEHSLEEVLEEDKKGDRRGTTVVDREGGTIRHHPMASGDVGQNLAKPVDADSAADKTMPEVQEECTIFHRVTYLGAATINAPRSEGEIQRNVAVLNDQLSDQAIEIAVSVPSTSEGSVILYDATTQMEMVRFKIHRILFFARGASNTKEEACFAFTCSHGETRESAIFQCHVFRCDIPEAVGRVFMCFAKAFQCVPNLEMKRQATKQNSAEQKPSSDIFLFELTLEIREEDGKGNFSAVPKDRNYFKLRSGLEKKLYLSVQQVSENSHDLVIERCFGLLVSPGRNVKHGDMQLIEMINVGSGTGEEKPYVVWGHWDPNDPTFEVLNQETSRDTRVFMTVAVDLVIQGIQEPIRFAVETSAKIYPQNERFWYFSRKQLVQQFSVHLRQHPVKSNNIRSYDVLSVETTGEIDRSRMNLGLNLSNFLRSPSIQSIDTPKDEEDSDSDEPLQSGMGEVSKDCSEVELESWAEILQHWQSNLSQRPKQLAPLVKRGIPEALRGEVWQRLAGCETDHHMLDTYRQLLAKESSAEEVILRDINRTFPANDFFKDSGGVGQDSLFKISKAYAVYDMEIGYCQGLSFLGAALLLHMPEEQSFTVLVKILFDYGLRDLFKDSFKELHLRLYQLDRLIEEHMPELWMHFIDLGIESHMYASQWFLTLFTAKFPLFLVFHIIDIFLLVGMESMFQVALALLMMSKKDLLALDFEGILKYFRVSLPKKYRSEEAARNLIKQACQLKVKKLKRYEKEFLIMKEQERNQVDPETRLTNENKRLMDDNMRLEILIKELVLGKIQAEERADTYSEELQTVKPLLKDTDDEKKRLEREANMVKEMLQREVCRNEEEGKRNTAIINEYKQICSQLSRRLEEEQASAHDTISAYKTKMSDCEKCAKYLPEINADAKAMGGSKDNAHEGGEDGNISKQMQDLELELAQTKVALAESECRNEDLTHQLSLAISEIESSKNSSWLWKTLPKFKEVATRRDSNKDSAAKETKTFNRDDSRRDLNNKEGNI